MQHLDIYTVNSTLVQTRRNKFFVNFLIETILYNRQIFVQFSLILETTYCDIHQQIYSTCLLWWCDMVSLSRGMSFLVD